MKELTGRNTPDSTTSRLDDVIVLFRAIILHVMSAVAENTDPLVVVTSQGPGLRSRVTAYLYDVTVTYHPRTLRCLYICTARYCERQRITIFSKFIVDYAQERTIKCLELFDVRAHGMI